jgi:pilus assembly protein CpaD
MSILHTSSAATAPAARLLPALALLALGLGACAPDRIITGSIPAETRQQRHPIVLANAPRTLDVFPTSAWHLDPRQRSDLAGYALDYRRYGQGPIVAALPAGGPNDAVAGSLLGEVRRTFGAAGVPSGHIVVTRYQALDPSLAAPIRLSFQKLQAKVASKCGLWPADLGTTNFRANDQNLDYHNFGCASQSNLASQVADPLDLVRGRGEVPGDTIRRMQDLKDIRENKDPSTNYKQDNQNRITQGVGT